MQGLQEASLVYKTPEVVSIAQYLQQARFPFLQSLRDLKGTWDALGTRETL